MNKSLSVVLLGLSLTMMTAAPAFAVHECSRQVVRSDGTKTITTECTASTTITSLDFWNRYLYGTLIRNLERNVQTGLQNLQDQWARISSAQDHAKQVAADMDEKIKQDRDAQEVKQQDAEIRMQDLKQQQEMQKERQIAMEDLQRKN